MSQSSIKTLNNMKKNIALILLLVLSLHVLAQNKNHIIRVDWKAIEKTVKGSV